MSRSIAKYDVFEIRITQRPDSTYETRVRSPAGQGVDRFELPADWVLQAAESPSDREGADLVGGPNREAPRDVGWVKEDSEAGPWFTDRVGSPKRIGGQLYKALFTDRIRALFDASLDQLSQKRDRGLCLQLKFDPRDPSQALLSQLPWEYLYRDDRRPSFLTQSESTPVVRYLELPGRTPKFELPRKLSILLVASDPVGDLEHLVKEVDQIKESWEQDNVEVTVLKRGDERRGLGSRLRDLLREDDYHVLHFMGHGDFDVLSGEGALLFESETGAEDRVSGRAFASWLVNLRSLRLVVLNACSTGRASVRPGADPFAGVAPALVEAGIPGVLAMQKPMPDRLASEFSRVLYQHMANGNPVEAAVSAARLELFACQPTSGEWGTPVLFERTRQILRIPPKIDVVLAWAWTAVSLVLLYLQVNMFFRNRSFPTLTPVDLGGVMEGDLAALIGVLFGIPLSFLSVFLIRQYVKNIRPPKSIRQEPAHRRLAVRLPIAFLAKIQGRRFVETAFQLTSFVLLFVVPMALQVYLHVRTVKATVYTREPAAVFASGLEHFTKYAPLVLTGDNYRYGTLDDRPERNPPEHINVTFFPFWAPWGLLMAHSVLLCFALMTCRQLVRKNE